MKQNDFQHQKNLCRIIPGQCVCVSECVCVYVCAHFCVVVVVCVCACTCHVVGRGGSMGRGNGRCVYVHVPVCACVCAHACGQYSWVCTVITQLTCQPPSAASWVVWTNCCRLPNFCCSIFSLCKASWKTPQIQNMGQASNVQNTYNRPTRTSDWASRLVWGTTMDKNNCKIHYSEVQNLWENQQHILYASKTILRKKKSLTTLKVINKWILVATCTNIHVQYTERPSYNIIINYEE